LKEPGRNREVKHEIDVNKPEPNQDQDITSNDKEVGEEKKEPHKPLPAFPSRLSGKIPKVDEVNQEILETFRKAEINIPLLDAIKQVPRYAQFLEELCTVKTERERKGKCGGKCVCCFPKEASPKCKDLGVFSIPCKIGNLSFDKAMLDLGASINVIHRPIYDKLHLGELKKN